jgi:hypothetical protein
MIDLYTAATKIGVGKGRIGGWVWILKLLLG